MVRPRAVWIMDVFTSPRAKVSDRFGDSGGKVCSAYSCSPREGELMDTRRANRSPRLMFMQLATGPRP